jgi:hypothetical protein
MIGMSPKLAEERSVGFWRLGAWLLGGGRLLAGCCGWWRPWSVRARRGEGGWFGVAGDPRLRGSDWLAHFDLVAWGAQASMNRRSDAQRGAGCPMGRAARRSRAGGRAHPTRWRGCLRAARWAGARATTTRPARGTEHRGEPWRCRSRARSRCTARVLGLRERGLSRAAGHRWRQPSSKRRRGRFGFGVGRLSSPFGVAPSVSTSR